MLQPLGGVVHIRPHDPIASAKLGGFVASGGEVVNVRPVLRSFLTGKLYSPAAAGDAVKVFSCFAPAKLCDIKRFVRFLIPDCANHHDLVEVRLKHIQEPLHIRFTVAGDYRQGQFDFAHLVGGIQRRLTLKRNTKNRRPGFPERRHHETPQED
jgi:hypothetical protein